VNDGFRDLASFELSLDEPIVQIEIPADYQAMKATAPALALAWRLAAREMFEAYFSAGYTAVDFCSRPAGGAPRGYYILAQGAAFD
jgi:predicted GNAT superfamily acetyltransferase